MVELPGSCVSPLCAQPGRVALTATRIYFQPFNISSNSPVEVYQLTKASRSFTPASLSYDDLDVI